MSAEEFGEWICIFKNEQLHPSADRLRHAQQLAAAHNGPLSRRDKQLWRALDLLPVEVEAAATAPPPAPPTAAELARQVDRLNRLADA